MTAPPAPAARSPRWPLLLGGLLSLAALLIGLAVWQDNAKGFRDAGAFAELLSAVFSLMSTIWLIVTVLLQRAQLHMQQQELASQQVELVEQKTELVLQRKEMERLANATAEQSRLMLAQNEIALKGRTLDQVRATIQAGAEDFHRIIGEDASAIKAAARAAYPEQARRKIGFIHIRPGRTSSRFDAFGEEPVWGDLSFADLASLLEGDFVGEALVRAARDADAIGTLDWFETELPLTLGKIETFEASEIFVLIGIAVAIVRRDRTSAP